MSTERNKTGLSRRILIAVAAFSFLPIRAFAGDDTVGYAAPLEKGPYMLGVASFPNPIESDQITLARKSKIEPSQKIPSQDNLKREIGKITTK